VHIGDDVAVRIVGSKEVGRCFVARPTRKLHAQL
jgi:hypothetical protein